MYLTGLEMGKQKALPHDSPYCTVVKRSFVLGATRFRFAIPLALVSVRTERSLLTCVVMDECYQ